MAPAVRGPLAGKIFRIGLMGAGSTEAMVALCLDALGDALVAQGVTVSPGAGSAAALEWLSR